MYLRMKHALAASALLAAAVALHARYPLTLGTDVFLIAAVIAFFYWLERRRGEVEERERDSKAVKVSARRRRPTSAGYREVESRCKLSLAVVVIVYLAFIARFSTVEHYLAAQRQRSIEQQVDRLVAADKWQEAAKYLEACLRQPLDAALRARAQVLLHHCWLHLIEGTSPAELNGIEAEAESLARDGYIDPELVANLRQHIARAKTIAQLRAEIEHVRRAAIQDIERERSRRETAERLTAEKTNTIQSQERDWQQKLAKLREQHDWKLFQLLQDWAESLAADLPLQRGKYQQAIDFGRRRAFDTGLAEQRLAAVDAALRAAEPRQLAPGTTAKLLSVRRDRHPPAIEAELQILDAAGRSVEGLAAKDFEILIDGQPAGRPLAGFVVPPDARLQLVVLVDCSGSTAGPALEAAKAGTAELLKQLDGRADVCLVAFNATVVNVTGWQSDLKSVTERLTSLRSDGGTALYQACHAAIRLLQDRPAPRIIVLFTDGKDSTAGVDVAVLKHQLAVQRITVHAVGLETREFDRAAIADLTAATSGELVVASQERELARRFAELSQTLRLPRYRLVIPCDEPGRKLSIRIGGKADAGLEVSLDGDQPPQTTQITAAAMNSMPQQPRTRP